MPLIASLLSLQVLLPGDGVPLSLLAATAVVTLVLTAIVASHVVRRSVLPTVRQSGLTSWQHRAGRLVFVPSRDPDARGRTRPRAPTPLRRPRVVSAQLLPA